VLHRDAIEHAPTAIVVELQYHALARIRLTGDRDQALVARVPGELELSPGDKVWIEVVGEGRVWSSGEGAER